MPNDQYEESENSPVLSRHEAISQFRAQVKQAKEENASGWELTRKLVEPGSFSSTLAQLAEWVRHSEQPPLILETLLEAIESCYTSSSKKDVNASLLKELTGLPPTKAVRALCLYFGLVEQKIQNGERIAPQVIEAFVSAHDNPYDWLLQVDHPSLLDLGAGDLSFEEELLDQYVSRIQSDNKVLTLHAVDRLQPGSQFGGVYHANPERLARFSQYPHQHLRFRFWGAKDMLDLNTLREQLNAYSIVTCHAPATPTFAYEPTRLSSRTIQDHLTRTKGAFKKVRVDGEEALEVQHRGRTLTFPSWKFVIRGPLALLDVMARRGQLCILSAIDAEVFWEILAQLVEDDAMRHSKEILTLDSLLEICPHVDDSLSSLKEGERCCLSDLTPLRTQFPHVLSPKPRSSQGFTFRYVEVRRGAVFANMPASFTAKQFSHMSEEVPPWFLLLIPELVSA